MKIEAIAIREKSRAPMQELTEASVTRESGVEGYFRGKPSKRQVTLLSKSQWQQACDEINAQLPWTTRRANILVSDVCFGPEWVGRQIQFGDLLLEVMLETDPCQRMDAQHQGLTKALTPEWRGGICCKVIQSGEIRIGDESR